MAYWDLKKKHFYFKIIILFCIFTIVYLNYNKFEFLNSLRSTSGPKVYDPIKELDIVHGLPVQFLKNYKNPCWFERKLYHNGSHIQKQGQLNNNEERVLRCLPYFFLIGQPKCGTTDLYERIVIHPEVSPAPRKGIHWWTRTRFGSDKNRTSRVSFNNYIDTFTEASEEIYKVTYPIENRNDSYVSQSHYFHPMVTGDGSPSTMWDSGRSIDEIYKIINNDPNGYLLEKRFKKQRNKIRFSRNRSRIHLKDNGLGNYKITKTEKETKRIPIIYEYGLPDLIYSILPHSKIIAVLREPVARAYSSYQFFKGKHPYPENFDEAVNKSIKLWNDCLKVEENSDVSCATNKTLQNIMPARLYIGMYSLYLRMWFDVFPKNQILILRTEDLKSNLSSTMRKIFSFLNLSKLRPDLEKMVLRLPIQNINKKKRDGKPMLKGTKLKLQKFYQKYNIQLEKMLGKEFMWKL